MQMTWEPITTAPKPYGVEVLAWNGMSIDVAWRSLTRPHGWRTVAGDIEPTHWQPLPEPPDASQN
jgi:hypothetical protein